jgi:hypothetical protein
MRAFERELKDWVPQNFKSGSRKDLRRRYFLAEN